MKRTAIYPGSFDPLTNGHIDIIERSLMIFDRVIVAVLKNPNKKGMFSVEERKELISLSLPDIPGVEVDSFDGLLVDYAVEKKACAVIRGLRAVSDFEVEFQMAMMNRRLNKDVQTIFFMTGLRWIFTSSSVIKEVAAFDGDVSSMVSPVVNERLKARITATRNG